MGLIEDLQGGFKKPKKKKEKTNNVYIKFDNDVELILFDNVSVDDDVMFILNSEHGEFLFECPETGKKFKLYRK